MNRYSIASLIALFLSGNLYAGNIPRPLVNLSVNPTISANSAGIFTYQYSISNPGINDGKIYSISIFLSQDATSDSSSSPDNIKHCAGYFKTSSADLLKTQTVTVVGSTSPQNWTCGYETRSGFLDKSYGWGARQERTMINPGATQSGFSLTSNGLPSIRKILIEPWIDVDALPSEYNSNVEKTVTLETSVRWLGQTIGPKFPPKVFVALDFINYLISLKEQSVSLGWIKEKGVANSLDVKLNNAKKKIASGDTKTAKNVLNAFQNEVQAQNGKHVSAEAYALLYFNAKYLIDHL